MKADDAKELRELCKEIGQLKNLLAEAERDKGFSRRSTGESSDPGLPAAGREGPLHAVRGERTTGLSGARPAQIDPAPGCTGALRRRAGAAGLLA